MRLCAHNTHTHTPEVAQVGASLVDLLAAPVAGHGVGDPAACCVFVMSYLCTTYSEIKQKTLLQEEQMILCSVSSSQLHFLFSSITSHLESLGVCSVGFCLTGLGGTLSLGGFCRHVMQAQLGVWFWQSGAASL